MPFACRRSYEWLDRVAQDASDALVPRAAPDVIGHGDWVCHNVRFAGCAVSAAYDWDSLIGASEPVLAGLSAGAHTEGSLESGDAPAPDEVAAFLADYDKCRASPFAAAEQSTAVAAATWVMAYNARCALSAVESGYTPGERSALSMLSRHRATYLSLRW
jgi:hypothetical protein